MNFDQLRSSFQAFCVNKSGSFATILAIAGPILLSLVAGSVDLFVYRNHRAELQNAADAAVLAAAREAALAGFTEDSAKQVVSSFIEGNLTNRYRGVTFEYAVAVDEANRQIRLTLTQDHYSYFFLGYFTGSPQIGVQAAARASGQSVTCIMVVDPKSKEAMKLSGNANVVASGCSAYANSRHPKGLTAKNTARVATQMTCIAGGYSGTSSNFTPLPITDCPTVSDPLVARALLVDNEVAGHPCAFTKLLLKGMNKTLTPGTYCGGLELTNGSTISLAPGIYVIKDGELKVDKGSSLTGDKVGFVFIGKKAKAEIKNDTKLSLSAPVDGVMAGILMYAQPVTKSVREYKIESKNAQRLVGTVYMPADKLTIGGDKDADGVCDSDPGILPGGPGCNADVGTASSWTAIIVKLLEATAGAKLVINSDYAGSPVPLPPGLGIESEKVILTE